ncbi:MAG: hypothetical protein R2736_02440 [Solirubrobacterales bacterium]
MANRGVARRLLDHTAFAAGALATAPLTGPADVVVVESPPLFTAAAAVGYARVKRAALVMNVADRWPATAVEAGRDRRCARHRRGRVARALVLPPHRAHHHAHRGIARALDRLPQAAGKVVHVRPAVDVDRFADAASPPLTGPLRIVYAGTVGLAQDVGRLVQAAELAGPEVVDVTIAGDGVDAAAVAAAAGRLPNVTWLGSVAPERVPALYAGAHAGARCCWATSRSSKGRSRRSCSRSWPPAARCCWPPAARRRARCARLGRASSPPPATPRRWPTRCGACGRTERRSSGWARRPPARAGALQPPPQRRAVAGPAGSAHGRPPVRASCCRPTSSGLRRSARAYQRRAAR